MLEGKQSRMQQFFPIQEQITPVVVVQLPMTELIQILLEINILPKFGADWSIFAYDSVNKVKYNSSENKGQIILTILS